MIKVVNKSLLAIAVSGVLVSPAVNATNGYFAHGYSTKEKGLAGAGTAYSQDAMAAATNPAGMAFVGERLDLGAALFSPSDRGYNVTGTPPGAAAPPNGVAGLPVVGPTGCQAPFGSTPGICQAPFSVNTGSVDSDNDFFLIPHVAFNWQLNDETTVGIAGYGNGGMNSEYSSGSAILPDASQPGLPVTELPGTFGDGNAGVNLEQVFLNISFSRKINDKHALGASIVGAGQRFAAKGLGNFGQFSLDPNNLDSNAHDRSYGVGLKVGYQGEIYKGLRFGASYQSKINMSKFDKYKGLFAEKGDFDIPSTYNFGVSLDAGSSGILVVDYQRINYSDIDSISNTISPLTNGSCLDALNNALSFGGQGATGSGCLGGSAGAGFGWEDIGIIKIGYQFDMDENTFRVGYSHSSQTIPKSETLFNILAPAVVQDHYTAGWTYRLAGNQEINLAGMYAPTEKVKGANPFDGGATQIEIKMSQWELQAGWGLKF